MKKNNSNVHGSSTHRLIYEEPLLQLLGLTSPLSLLNSMSLDGELDDFVDDTYEF